MLCGTTEGRRDAMSLELLAVQCHGSFLHGGWCAQIDFDPVLVVELTLLWQKMVVKQLGVSSACAKDEPVGMEEVLQAVAATRRFKVECECILS